MKRLDISGKKFGTLTAIKDVGCDKKYGRLWECLCDCGNTITIPTTNLTTDKTKSCGCLRGRPSHPEGLASFNRLYIQYKQNAKKRDYKFELTKDQFREITKQNCIYCGVMPAQSTLNSKNSNGPYIYNGVDRLDNLKGYIEDNCVPCCKYCNYAKNDLTEEEFLNRIVKIYNNCCR